MMEREQVRLGWNSADLQILHITVIALRRYIETSSALRMAARCVAIGCTCLQSFSKIIVPPSKARAPLGRGDP